MIAVTGASGQLGRLVIAHLLKSVSPGSIIALVRNPQTVADLAEKGVVIRQADYDQPEGLSGALAGVHRLLLISSSAIGHRVRQHKAVIDAAVQAKVPEIAYTSLLHADKSPLALAEEHRQTEAMLKESGLAHVILRNGWYTENYLASVPPALRHGAFIGCAGQGRIASAARRDYAEAAAAVLGARVFAAGKIYELAGDESYSLEELAAELSRQSGKTIPYQDLPAETYKGILIQNGLPEAFAAIIADSDSGAAKGALFDSSRQLSALTGRPTIPLAVSMSIALAQ